MRNLLRRLWADDCGALIATEWVFVATILVLGAITGLVAMRQAVIFELDDFADSFMSLSQSYRFTGQSNCESSTAGSRFQDHCDSIVIHSTRPECTGEDQLPCD